MMETLVIGTCVIVVAYVIGKTVWAAMMHDARIAMRKGFDGMSEDERRDWRAWWVRDRKRAEEWMMRRMEKH